uniref:Uncharacterized protein n=1 Tax=Cacopsylla melanoneura TaxID=428564 RepID=A0A8D8ZB77_9HEMI
MKSSFFSRLHTIRKVIKTIRKKGRRGQTYKTQKQKKKKRVEKKKKKKRCNSCGSKTHSQSIYIKDNSKCVSNVLGTIIKYMVMLIIHATTTSPLLYCSKNRCRVLVFARNFLQLGDNFMNFYSKRS